MSVTVPRSFRLRRGTGAWRYCAVPVGMLANIPTNGARVGLNAGPRRQRVFREACLLAEQLATLRYRYH
ncbi:hypothetical protein YERSI8AC_560004 [Enterobacterales bacterium 8AC]|nr:hypothetical protein YERSI8AC_560004 [Enterobacterales bacterium 8AC]